MLRPARAAMIRLLALLFGALLASSCGAPTDGRSGANRGDATQASMASGGEALDATSSRPPGPPEPPKPKPWTDIFLSKSIVLADLVQIEGPPGLLDHLLLRSDDALFERVVETTTQGLTITITPRHAGDLVRCQLDRWHISAIRRIEVLERPGGTGIKLRVSGQALWQDMNGEEKRMNELVWEDEVQ